MNEVTETSVEFLPIQYGRAMPDYRYKAEGVPVKEENRWNEFQRFVAENEEMLTAETRDRDSFIQGLSRAFAITRFFLEYV